MNYMANLKKILSGKFSKKLETWFLKVTFYSLTEYFQNWSHSLLEYKKLFYKIKNGGHYFQGKLV